MYRILTPLQMKEAETASAQLGVSLWELMRNAGAGLMAEVGMALTVTGAKRISFLCGSGNNGGDGLVCAQLLSESKYAANTAVTVYLLDEPKTELAKKALEMATAPEIRHGTDEELFMSEMIVDCVFGTGFHGTLSPELRSLFARVQSCGAMLIACDCPSGVNCLTGEVSEGTLSCDETVTFHARKVGMCLKPARLNCGDPLTFDIGIPAGWEFRLSDNTVITEPSSGELHDLLPERPAHSHKGTFGRLLLVCGSGSYIGAAAIASRAALRTGCGITELAAPGTVIQAIAGTTPECVYTCLPCDPEGFITADALPVLLEHAKSCDACVIGCGLGQTDGTAAVVEGLVKSLTIPLIIDADGINQLAKNIDVLRDKNCEVLLTPHVGEMARLCGVKPENVLADRITLARRLSEEYGVTVHLKDSTTVTVSGESCYISDRGCSALAKGGSGDMLAGVIGSMAAQGVEPTHACLLGTYIVGRTAEMLCEGSSPAAVTASDIIAEFRHSLMVL